MFRLDISNTRECFIGLSKYLEFRQEYSAADVVGVRLNKECEAWPRSLVFALYVCDSKAKYANKIIQLSSMKITTALQTNAKPDHIIHSKGYIETVFDYVNVIWTTCDKVNLGRVLKLQKRAARVVLTQWVLTICRKEPVGVNIE